MKNATPFLAIVMLVWAGLTLGGNIIAAPAKFQVDSLTQSQLLLVGRAQFAWLGSAELVFASATILLCGFGGGRIRVLGLLAVAAFGLQQFGLQPLLEARTDLIVAGQPAPESTLHLVFIALEIAKIALLALGGTIQVICDGCNTSG